MSTRHPKCPPGLWSGRRGCTSHSTHAPTSLTLWTPCGSNPGPPASPQKIESTISPSRGLGFPSVPNLAPPSSTWSPSAWNRLPGGGKAWATWAGWGCAPGRRPGRPGDSGTPPRPQAAPSGAPCLCPEGALRLRGPSFRLWNWGGGWTLRGTLRRGWRAGHGAQVTHLVSWLVTKHRTPLSKSIPTWTTGDPHVSWWDAATGTRTEQAPGRVSARAPPPTPGGPRDRRAAPDTWQGGAVGSPRDSGRATEAEFPLLHPGNPHGREASARGPGPVLRLRNPGHPEARATVRALDGGKGQASVWGTAVSGSLWE